MKQLTRQSFEAMRDHLFDRIHKTGEEIKNDLPNILRRAIEHEAWQHFTDLEGRPFDNLVDWMTATHPCGASMGRGRNALTYEDVVQLCARHPEVRRELVAHPPAGAKAMCEKRHCLCCSRSRGAYACAASVTRGAITYFCTRADGHFGDHYSCGMGEFTESEDD